jgi:hypothetical protein
MNVHPPSVDERTSLCRSMHIRPAVVDECTSSVCLSMNVVLAVVDDECTFLCLSSMNVRPDVKSSMNVG